MSLVGWLWLSRNSFHNGEGPQRAASTPYVYLISGDVEEKMDEPMNPPLLGETHGLDHAFAFHHVVERFSQGFQELIGS